MSGSGYLGLQNQAEMSILSVTIGRKEDLGAVFKFERARVVGIKSSGLALLKDLSFNDG